MTLDMPADAEALSQLDDPRADADHDHHKPGSHDHVSFESASLVSALVCTGCGSYVDGNRQAVHQRWHDRIAELEAVAGIVESEPGLF